MAVKRTTLPIGFIVVTFSCPNCKTHCSHPTAGEKVLCPKCGQKLLVPSPPHPPPQNKTVLAVFEPTPSIVQPPLPVAQLPFAEPILTVHPVHEAPELIQPPPVVSRKRSLVQRTQRSGSRSDPSWIAVLLTLGGLGLVAYIWLVFDTTNPPFRTDIDPKQARLIGIIIGIVSFCSGIVLLLFSRRSAESETCYQDEDVSRTSGTTLAWWPPIMLAVSLASLGSYYYAFQSMSLNQRILVHANLERLPPDVSSLGTLMIGSMALGLAVTVIVFVVGIMKGDKLAIVLSSVTFVLSWPLLVCAALAGGGGFGN